MLKSADGRVTANPVAVLESVRRFADRITVFSQAGQIKVPPAFRAAYAYLERSVVPVKAPRKGGIFHPKVWALRFVDPDGDVRHRFLCLSRNLTFDRSWDTVLRLDGRPTGAVAELSQPIANFIRTLPNLAVQPMAQARRADINRFAAELATSDWEPLPDRMRVERMWPLGHDGQAAWPFPDGGWRRLIVSPFVEPGFIDRFTQPTRGDLIVSRPETLDAIGAPALSNLERKLVLRSDAEGERDAPEVSDEGNEPAAPDAELRGLHAKLFVIDDAWWSHIWTGSANATGAAFNGNVEFLVELRGRNTTHGAAKLVEAAPGPAVGFGRLLTDYEPADVAVSPSEEDEAVHDLDRLAMDLGSLKFRAMVGEPEGDQYGLRLTGEGDLSFLRRRKAEAPAISVRPLSLGTGWAVTPATEGQTLVADWQVSFTALTAFFVIELATGGTRGGSDIIPGARRARRGPGEPARAGPRRRVAIPLRPGSFAVDAPRWRRSSVWRPSRPPVKRAGTTRHGKGPAPWFRGTPRTVDAHPRSRPDASRRDRAPCR